MKKSGSIRNKLIFTNLIAITSAFIIVGIIVFINLQNLSKQFLEMSEARSLETSKNMTKDSQEQTEKISHIYEQSLYKKGEILLNRDSLVLKPLFIDNSYNSIRALLSNLFSLDNEILHLSFFTVEDERTIKAWAYYSRDFPQGLDLKTTYNHVTQAWDSKYNNQKVSIKDPEISGLINFDQKQIKLIDYTFKTSQGDQKTVKAYQCTIPVFEGSSDEFSSFRIDGETIGFLRYIITLEKMQNAIALENELLSAKLQKQKVSNATAASQVRNATKSSLTQSLIKLAFSAVIILIFSYIFAVYISNKLSEPILDLQKNAQMISQGNYSEPISIQSSDEIGQLANNFDQMRIKVQEFTQNLQGLVDQKTKEISDILNSIDQGIFTINQDLTLNSQHSKKAEQIYAINDFKNASLIDLWSLNNKSFEDFKAWLKMISQPKRLKRWKKYEELKPIREFQTSINGQERTIQLDFQAILEEGQVVKLMVLSTDITEKRKIKHNLELAQLQQKKTMERVTGLINNDSENIADLFKSIKNTLKNLGKLDQHDYKKSALIDSFREIHTIKGNAGSLGFNELAAQSSKIEDFLQNILDCSPGFEGKLNTSKNWLNPFENEYQELCSMRDKLFLQNEEIMSINKHQFKSLLTSIENGTIQQLEEISKELKSLNKAPFATLCQKYENILSQYRQKHGLNIDKLQIKSSNKQIDKTLLKKFDTAIIHAIRNSLDHGFNGKPAEFKAAITLDIVANENLLQLSIEDNGKGINAESTVIKAVERGLISQKEALLLNDNQKLNLIFLAGFSSKNQITELSGRGYGMDIIKSSIEEHGGNVKLESISNQGTKITLSLPA